MMKKMSPLALKNAHKESYVRTKIQKSMLAFIFINPPASVASREVANLEERKNPHTLVYGVKEFVCLSVCL